MGRLLTVDIKVETRGVPPTKEVLYQSGHHILGVVNGLEYPGGRVDGSNGDGGGR